MKAAIVKQGVLAIIGIVFVSFAARAETVIGSLEVNPKSSSGCPLLVKSESRSGCARINFASRSMQVSLAQYLAGRNDLRIEGEWQPLNAKQTKWVLTINQVHLPEEGSAPAQ